MCRALCFLLLVSLPALATEGNVTTLDGRKLEGTIHFIHHALAVQSTQDDVVEIAVTNIASAKFSTNSLAPQGHGTGNGLLGIYYNSTNLTGGSVIRLDEMVDFDWQQAPALGVRRDAFSVRWMAELEAPGSDSYTIYFGSDDGGRIYFDGKLMADSWRTHPYAETNITVNLRAGERHKLQLEYFDAFDKAQARLSWSTPSLRKTIIPRDRLYAASFEPAHPAQIDRTEGLLATYYNSSDFTSNSFTRVDPQIDFDWRGAPPAPGISSNDFSVRWSGNLLVTNSGEYTFYILSGRPIRFFINDKLMNDPSLALPQKTCTATLRAGEPCELRLELRATNGAVGAQFLWSSTNIVKSIVPAHHLSPAIAPTGTARGDLNSAWPTGAMLITGATIAAPIRSANQSTIHFHGLFSAQSLPLARVARIQVRPLDEDMIAMLPKGRTGVLLKSRDFIDGDFEGIENGRVRIGSVLFGNRTFDMAKDVIAIVLRDVEPLVWRFSITAKDGTVVYGQGLSIEPGRMAIADAPQFAVSEQDASGVARRPDSNATP